MATFNLIWVFKSAQKIVFMPYCVVTSPILSSQIFGHLLDVATLLWLYATGPRPQDSKPGTMGVSHCQLRFVIANCGYV